MTVAEISSRRRGQSLIVQKWARYHALTVIRWLGEVYSQLARCATYKGEHLAFFGTWEYFDTDRLDDTFLKTRKVWPLR